MAVAQEHCVATGIFQFCYSLRDPLGQTRFLLGEMEYDHTYIPEIRIWETNEKIPTDTVYLHHLLTHTSRRPKYALVTAASGYLSVLRDFRKNFSLRQIF